jgi:uncharacterized metal-binding protein YceD (DUF177 family)
MKSASNPMAQSDHDWSVLVRVEDIPETGRHYDLEPDAKTRVALARAAGLEALDRFAAAFDVTRENGGLRVTGTVSACVRQACVVTLEPLDNIVEETVDLLFVPQDALAPAVSKDEERPPEAADSPEPLVGGAVDLGAVATEFLVLGIDPYPRKPGAVFAPPAAKDEGDSPFAALAGLKKETED